MGDMPHTLELYGASGCPYTAELRDQLELQGTAFVEFDVERDPNALQRLLELSGTRSVPTLVERGHVIAVGWQGRCCMV